MVSSSTSTYQPTFSPATILPHLPIKISGLLKVFIGSDSIFAIRKRRFVISGNGKHEPIPFAQIREIRGSIFPPPIYFREFVLSLRLGLREFGSESNLAWKFVIQGQGRFFGGQTPQFFRVAHDRPPVRVRLGPRPQLVEKPVHVITRLRGQLVFGPPDFFEDGIRFHGFNLSQGQWACKSPATPDRDWS